MTQSASTTTGLAGIILRASRLCRFLIFLCTAGWAFPHVCTEGMDLTRIQNEHTARKA